MNDFSMNQLVSYVLERLGHPLLAKDAYNGKDIEFYLDFIKQQKIESNKLNEFIDYFLT